MVETLRWFSDESMERAIAEGHWAAGVLGIDLPTLEAKSRVEVPEEKWWEGGPS